MGNRATIEVKDGERSVYLYTHWHGSELEQTLRRALARRQRWNDACYLTRIIFCEMVKDDISGETGFGISAYETESEHGPLLVDVEKQTVNGKPFAAFIGGPVIPRGWSHVGY